MKKKIFIFAGELSGDMYGARVVKAMHESSPEITFSGVAGPEMRQAGVDAIFGVEDFSVMGFSDVLYAFPKLLSQFRKIRDYILHTSPEAVLFIDSPSFSLRMACSLRKHHFKGKIIQYICPSIWAWGKHRIKNLIRDFDLLLTILPFEYAYFPPNSLPVKYVGHPLKEIIQTCNYDPSWMKLFGIKSSENLVALFPGSRVAEIQRNFGVQLEVAKLMKQKYPETIFGISCSHDTHMHIMQEMLHQAGFKHNSDMFFIPRLYTYQLMAASKSAIAKSGTVTLELALHKCPTVVTYQLSTLNRLVAKYFLRLQLPHYSIANILAGKELFPEFIVKKCISCDIFHELERLSMHTSSRKNCIEECEKIEENLHGKTASQEVSKAILDLC